MCDLVRVQCAICDKKKGTNFLRQKQESLRKRTCRKLSRQSVFRYYYEAAKKQNMFTLVSLSFYSVLLVQRKFFIIQKQKNGSMKKWEKKSVASSKSTTNFIGIHWMVLSFFSSSAWPSSPRLSPFQFIVGNRHRRWRRQKQSFCANCKVLRQYLAFVWVFPFMIAVATAAAAAAVATSSAVAVLIVSSNCWNRIAVDVK